MHDEVDFDDVARSVVVHDARVDRLDLFRKRHGFVDDELLELERSGRSREVVKVVADRVSPNENEDDCPSEGPSLALCWRRRKRTGART